MMNEKKELIFLVDDDPISQKILETQFKEHSHFEIKTFSTGEDCLNNLRQKPAIIFLDYYLNATNPKAETGLQILDKIKEADPNIQVVMLSSQEKLEIAINCMKHDAFDYIVKGESAFHRAQKAIAIIFHRRRTDKEVVLYRTATIVTSITILGIIVAAVIKQIYY